MEKSRLERIGLAAAVVTAVATLLLGLVEFLEWPFPKPTRAEQVAAGGPTASSPVGSGAVPERGPAGREPQGLESSVQADGPPMVHSGPGQVGGRSGPLEASTVEVPFEFALGDMEQQVLLGGRASVAAEFNRVGEMEVLTVRASTLGRRPESRAVLTAGARFELQVDGLTYVVSAVRIDSTSKRATFRFDHLGPP